jgi:hypothetical protein
VPGLRAGPFEQLAVQTIFAAGCSFSVINNSSPGDNQWINSASDAWALQW